MKPIVIKMINHMLYILVEILIFLPVLVLFNAYIFRDIDIWIFLSLLTYFSFIGVLTGAVSGFISKPISVVSGLLFGTAPVFVIYTFSFKVLLLTVSSGILVYRYYRIFIKANKRSISVVIFWIGYGLYFILYFFFSRLPELGGYVLLVLYGGILAIIIGLLTINTNQLKEATQSKDNSFGISSIIVRNNRILIALTIMAVFVIAGLEYVRQAIRWLGGGLVYIIVGIINFISGLLVYEEIGSDFMKVQPPILLEGEAANPSWWTVMIERLMYFIAIIICIALLILMVRMLYKWIIHLFGKLLDFLKNNKPGDETTGFTDERESLLKLEKLGRDYKDKLKKWIDSILVREKKWEDITNNTERVRFLYKHFIMGCIKRGYKFKAYLTPEECGRDIARWDEEKNGDAASIVNIYYHSRYGRGNIKEDLVNTMKNRIL